MSLLPFLRTSGPRLALSLALAGCVACAPGAKAGTTLAPRLPSGYLAGAFLDAAGRQHPAAWVSGKLLDLDGALPEGARGGVVTDLSLSWGRPTYGGRFVGADGEVHLFSLAQGRLTDLGAAPAVVGTEGHEETGLLGSEESGVGFTVDQEGRHVPAAWVQGVVLPLTLDGLPGARGGQGRAMVRSGGKVVAAGFYFDTDYAQRPCVWTPEGAIDLAGSLPSGSLGGVVNVIALGWFR